MTITDALINDKYLHGENRLILEHNRIKLPELVKSIKNNPSYMTIDLDWSSSWDDITQSRLIESFIINIPVTPIIVYEKNHNFHEVVDGKERLRTIVDFYSDCLILTGLEIETDLEECRYSTLPVKIKDRLNKRSLDFINCMSASSNQSELEIERLISAVKKRLKKPMNKITETIAQYTYRVSYSSEDECYLAECEELGIMAHGDTQEEAIVEVKEATRVHLLMLEEDK